MKKLIALFLILFMSTPLAAAPKKVKAGHALSLGLMILTSSTVQGGQGPKGSTVLSQFEYNYIGKWWAAGMFYQADQQGEVETDTAIGPKVEAHWRMFYAELGYALYMVRAFSDRAIAEQKGDGYFFGAGVRFQLSSSWFFQGNYKIRVQNIKTQDGVKMGEPITQTDGYPLAGFGFKF